MGRSGWTSALRCLLIFVLLVSTTSGIGHGKFSCGHLKESLKDSRPDLLKLVPTVSSPAALGAICAGSMHHGRGETCCHTGLETQFLKMASDQFGGMLRNANEKLLGLITGHLDVIRERIRQSFQVTSVAVQLMLNETYPEVGKRLRVPLDQFFMRLQNILASSGDEHTVDRAVEEFFSTYLFPQLYLCAVRDCRNGDSLSPVYTNCLAKLVNSTLSHYRQSSSLPVIDSSGQQQRLLGDMLLELKEQLRKAIETVRLYTNALELAAEIVRKSSHQRTTSAATTSLSDSCQKALTRLKFCGLCGHSDDMSLPSGNFSSEFIDADSMEMPRTTGNGGAAPVCRNFCLNVVSGCLSPFISPIETQWDGLLRELKMFSYLLANGNSHWDLEVVLAKADVALQRIVDRAIDEKLQLMAIVEDRCGPVEILSNTKLEDKKESDELNKRMNIRSTDQSLFNYFETVMLNLSQDYIGWFAKIPVEICDVGFAKEGDCWNGERVGRYGKDLVILGQANPEVSGSEQRDPSSVGLADRLELLQKKLQESPSVKTPRANSQRPENRRKPAAAKFPETQVIESDIDDEADRRGWFGSGNGESDSSRSDTLSDDEDLDLGSGSGAEPDLNDPSHRHQANTQRPTDDPMVEPGDVSMAPQARPGSQSGSNSRNYAIPVDPPTTRRSPTSSSSHFGSSRVCLTVLSILSLSLWLRLNAD